MERLSENDIFVDAVVNATRAAEATHQEKKLLALRSGVQNSLAADAPSVDEQARFFRLVDQFTAGHLVLLTFLDDPAKDGLRRGMTVPDEMSRGMTPGSLANLVDSLPEFSGEREWATLLANDLHSATLLTRTLTGMMSGTSLWHSSTSPLGKRFLEFVGLRDDA